MNEYATCEDGSTWDWQEDLRTYPNGSSVAGIPVGVQIFVARMDFSFLPIVRAKTGANGSILFELRDAHNEPAIGPDGQLMKAKLAGHVVVRYKRD